MENLSYLEDLRARNKDLHARRAELWVREANRRESDLSRLLITLAVLVFTVSSPIITKTGSLDHATKILLVGSWVFDLLSLVFGIWVVREDTKLFSILKKTASFGEQLWSLQIKDSADFKARVEKNREKQRGVPAGANPVPLSLQLFTVLIAFLLLFAVGWRILF